MRLNVNFGDVRMPERFWLKTTPCPMSGCWLWTAAHLPYGYGMFDRKLAHRTAYLKLVGDVPEGLELDHLCKLTCCVNPLHLEPVTHLVNVQRKIVQVETHCKNGHEFTPENTRTSFVNRRHGKQLRRTCRECNAKHTRDTRAKLTENGICIRCKTAPAIPDRDACAVCLKSERERVKAWASKRAGGPQ